MRRPFVAGNWKMNGSAQMARELASAVCASAPTGSCDVALCPPFPYLAAVAAVCADGAVEVGAQDVAATPAGAFTGEVAAEMVADIGCRFALVGHSERRALFGETDAVVAAKCARAREAGLTPVVCLGETLDERESDRTQAVVARQLDAVIEACGVSMLGAAVLAYEPVWAIGTGRTATPEQAQEVHAFLRARVAERDAAVASELRILYGGSVKPDNAASLMAMDDIDGGLIGGAALDAQGFLSICEAAGG